MVHFNLYAPKGGLKPHPFHFRNVILLPVTWPNAGQMNWNNKSQDPKKLAKFCPNPLTAGTA